jgi:hypothetical protein
MSRREGLKALALKYATSARDVFARLEAAKTPDGPND